MPPEPWMNDSIRAAATKALASFPEQWSDSAKATNLLDAIGPLIAEAIEEARS